MASEPQTMAAAAAIDAPVDFKVTYCGKDDDDDNVPHIETRTLRGGTTIGDTVALNRGETAECNIESGGVTLIITEKSRTVVMDTSTDPE